MNDAREALDVVSFYRPENDDRGAWGDRFDAALAMLEAHIAKQSAKIELLTDTFGDHLLDIDANGDVHLAECEKCAEQYRGRCARMTPEEGL